MIAYEYEKVAPSNTDGIKNKRNEYYNNESKENETNSYYENKDTKYYTDEWKQDNEKVGEIKLFWKESQENNEVNNGWVDQESTTTNTNTNTNSAIADSGGNQRVVKNYEYKDNINNFSTLNSKNVVNKPGERPTFNIINSNNNVNTNSNTNTNTNTNTNDINNSNNINNNEEVNKSSSTIEINSNVAANIDNQNQIGDSNVKAIDSSNGNGTVNSPFPTFSIIMIVAACVLAVAVFVGVKVKGMKKDDEEKEKEIMEQHIRNYENSYPIQDYLNLPINVEEVPKSPTESSELSGISYSEPFTIFKSNSQQKSGFFPSQKLASSLCSPEAVLIDSQFEKKPEDCIRNQQVSNIRFSLSELGSSYLQKESSYLQKDSSSFGNLSSSLPYTSL